MQDTYGDTIKCDDDDMGYANKGPVPLGLSCFKGPRGVKSLSFTMDVFMEQTTALNKTVKSPGAVLHGHEITWARGEELGTGSLGRVFSALDQQTGQMIAVKEVRIETELAPDLKLKETLEHEISLLKHLKHPNIVSYLGNDAIGNCLYIYLEYMPGGSLASVLATFGSFDENLIAVYTRELLNGLEFLHTRHPPVVHRDIKGANVLVGMDCKVKLSDFGCSKRSAQTLSRTMKGSIPWMAPEVIQNKGYGRPADIWSLGCVVVEMGTGTRPWGEFDNAMAMMVRIAMSEDSPPVPPGFSTQAQDFVETCVRREPLLRLSATDLLAHEWVAELEDCSLARRGTQEILNAPNYATLQELLPNYLE